MNKQQIKDAVGLFLVVICLIGVGWSHFNGQGEVVEHECENKIVPHKCKAADIVRKSLYTEKMVSNGIWSHTEIVPVYATSEKFNLLLDYLGLKFGKVDCNGGQMVIGKGDDDTYDCEIRWIDE